MSLFVFTVSLIVFYKVGKLLVDLTGTFFVGLLSVFGALCVAGLFV